MSDDSPLYYKNNRLKQLRAFHQVVRAGSISRAADRLCLSQPSVSLQLQALERELGVILFERRGPHLRLTPEGETLYRLAEPLVEGIDKLHETFAAQFGNINSGELNIGAGESTILYILPEPVRTFVTQHPRVRLKMHNVTGRNGMKMLRAGEIDFAVGSMLDVPEDMEYRPVVTFDPVLITPKGHPLGALSGSRELTLEDIGAYGLILPPAHLSTWRIVRYVFQQHDVAFSVTLEAGGWEVIKKYVELGLGISIVTDICLDGNEALERIPLGRYFPQRSYGLVLRRGGILSAQAQRFVEILEAHYHYGKTPRAIVDDSAILAAGIVEDTASLSSEKPARRSRKAATKTAA